MSRMTRWYVSSGMLNTAYFLSDGLTQSIANYFRVVCHLYTRTCCGQPTYQI